MWSKCQVYRFQFPHVISFLNCFSICPRATRIEAPKSSNDFPAFTPSWLLIAALILPLLRLAKRTSILFFQTLLFSRLFVNHLFQEVLLFTRLFSFHFFLDAFLFSGLFLAYLSLADFAFSGLFSLHRLLFSLNFSGFFSSHLL